MKITLGLAICYLGIINFVAFVLCGWDKRKAKAGSWRTKEKTLLLSCILGGSPAFLVGMRVFRHKTKKPLFKFGVPTILLVQIAVLAFICYRMYPFN